MRIRIKLFATLGQYRGSDLLGTPFYLDVPEGSTLADLIQSFNIPDEEVKICYVNGRVQEWGYVLREGDDAGIFPPIGGGSG